MSYNDNDDYIIELSEYGDGLWRKKESPKKIPWLNIILFLLTFLTTTFAGTILAGKDPFIIKNLKNGLPFSLSLLTILLFHEFGHYILSKKHNVEASLPYFIPAPSFIGTFGAIIKMKSNINSKNQLIDIGTAGPISGFLISLPFLIYGISKSTIVDAIPEVSISLGDSLLIKIMIKIIIGDLPENKDIMLHPVAFAGWIGCFVTAMNLFPVGQLDGGHISYALFTKKSVFISRLFIVILIILGFFAWEGWFIWAFLLIVIGTKHPPVLDEDEELTPLRKFLGIFSLIVFILTFIPTPFK
ncbi:MAG: site-2 protease family protein [Proteobacteria bacterium]|nr:site-2 protease family protein [Pseudomonadota bacterium]